MHHAYSKLNPTQEIVTLIGFLVINITKFVSAYNIIYKKLLCRGATLSWVLPFSEQVARKLKMECLATIMLGEIN